VGHFSGLLVSSEAPYAYWVEGLWQSLCVHTNPLRTPAEQRGWLTPQDTVKRIARRGVT